MRVSEWPLGWGTPQDFSAISTLQVEQIKSQTC